MTLLVKVGTSLKSYPCIQLVEILASNFVVCEDEIYTVKIGIDCLKALKMLLIKRGLQKLYKSWEQVLRWIT